MHALPFILVALGFMAIGYRYYSAFIAARVLVLDAKRRTPAHVFKDGQNYVPTSRWVLFGHHFAAIAGAGPLIGPVLAAQFGFLPGFLWLVIGVVLGGAVHDFVVLIGSVRHDGKSIAQIARAEIGVGAGRVAGVAVLVIIVVGLAGLGVAVVNALTHSAWGTFTLAMTIPIALAMGAALHSGHAGGGVHGGGAERVRVVTLAGVAALVLALWAGGRVAGTPIGEWFSLSRGAVIAAIAIYGFVASVLPVWVLLCPRDYLSSFVKVGVVILLSAAVVVVNPELHQPMISSYASGGGPIVPGKWFPFVFITIACGAISGFHALVASGTTPKMLDNERDARVIGYGAMLMEGWVGLTSLIAAAALYPADYFAINLSPDAFARLGLEAARLPELSAQVGESVAGRPGGAVSLAVGMAQIFSKLPGLETWLSYFYHFAILFEALFILTVIDTGTRVGRYLVQEWIGALGARVGRPKWGRPESVPGSLVSTALVVAAWAALIWTGSIATLWPLFGISNQLVAAIALTVGTVWIVRRRGWGLAWVTALPLAFVSVVTLTAGAQSIAYNYWPLFARGERLVGGFDIAATVLLMTSLMAMLGLGARRVGRGRANREKMHG